MGRVSGYWFTKEGKRHILVRKSAIYFEYRNNLSIFAKRKGGLGYLINKKGYMRYRIKIHTTKRGVREYLPQVRKWFMWFALDHNGEIDYSWELWLKDIREALERIEEHYEENEGKAMDSIGIEYVNR